MINVLGRLLARCCSPSILLLCTTSQNELDVTHTGRLSHQLGIFGGIQGLQRQCRSTVVEIEMNELLTVGNIVNDETPGLGQAEHRQLVVGETKQQTLAFREMGPVTRPWFNTAGRQRRRGC